MITVTTIDSMGGACPFQIEGATSDGRSVYARYRWGRLTVRVGDETVYAHSPDPTGWEGCLNGATVAALTKGVIEWPAEVVNDGEPLYTL